MTMSRNLGALPDEPGGGTWSSLAARRITASERILPGSASRRPAFRPRFSSISAPRRRPRTEERPIGNVDPCLGKSPPRRENPGTVRADAASAAEGIEVDTEPCAPQSSTPVPAGTRARLLEGVVRSREVGHSSETFAADSGRTIDLFGPGERPRRPPARAARPGELHGARRRSVIGRPFSPG